MVRAGVVIVVTVVVGGVHLELGGGGTVVVDGIQVRLPYLSPTLTLYSHGDNVVVNTNVGLQVVWGAGGQVEVLVGGEHAGSTCGLCGNFNNLPQDDLMLPSTRLSQSVEEFLAGWRMGEDCEAPPSSPRCSSSGPTLSGKDSDLAHRLCSILKGPDFRECHRLVPPDPYMRACRREVCECPGDMSACLCATLNLYSTLCTRAGLVLAWRTPLLCDVTCPPGMVWSECVPPCGPPDCDYLVSHSTKQVPARFSVLSIFALPSPVSSSFNLQCHGPCVPGCTCPPGFAFEKATCVKQEDCP